MTVSQNRYVPFLKGKKGEFDALKQLSSTCRASLTPFIDIPRIPIKNQSLPIENHLNRQAERVAAAWGTSSSLFVDLHDLPLETRTSSGIHHLTYIANRLSSTGVSFIPVTGTERDEPYQHAVRDIQSSHKQVAIRLLPDDIEASSALENELMRVLEAVRTSPKSAHLLLDLGSVAKQDAAHYVAKCRSAINALSRIDEYLTLTVIGSSMPQTLSEKVKSNSTASISRKELDIWSQLQRPGSVRRHPSFGDYGIVHPDLMDIDPRKMTVVADIRYTTNKEMWIIRGSSTKRHPDGFKQYHTLAKTLTDDRRYSGRGFSWGDEEIHMRAYPIATTKPGNKTTWVTIATNHHLEFVVRELPKLAGNLML